MTYTRRYFLLIVGLVLAVTAYSAYWHVLADRSLRAFESWVLARVADGYIAEFEGYTVTGFPGRIELIVDRPHLANPQHRLTWSFASDRLIIYTQPWNLSHLIVDFGPAQNFAWVEQNMPQQARMTESMAKMSLRLAQGQLERLDADLSDIVLTGTTLPGSIAAARAQAHLRRADTDSDTKRTTSDGHDLHITIDNTVLPPELAGTLGPKLGLIRAEILLSQPEPNDIDQLAAWRDAGGIIDVSHLDVKWGPVDLRSTGTLTLDREMRPLAALVAEVRGYGEAIDALAKSGQMHKGVARNLRLGMQLLAKPGTDGQPVLSVPITAQDGMLFIGPLRIMMLNPLPWGDGQNPVHLSPDRPQ